MLWSAQLSLSGLLEPAPGHQSSLRSRWSKGCRQCSHSGGNKSCLENIQQLRADETQNVAIHGRTKTPVFDYSEAISSVRSIRRLYKLKWCMCGGKEKEFEALLERRKAVSSSPPSSWKGQEKFLIVRKVLDCTPKQCFGGRSLEHNWMLTRGKLNN